MPRPPLDTIRLILVEPFGPLNVGSVARVMKNMGLTHLVLVAPHCDHLGTEARQMAVHAGEVLARARVVQSLPEALKGCRKAIATTGRPHHLTHPLESPRMALPWLLQDSVEPDSAALIFGPEDRGLNNQELSQAHRFVYIPSNPVYPSLNLAQAVGICCYELYQVVGDGEDGGDGEDREGSREAGGAGGQGRRGDANVDSSFPLPSSPFLSGLPLARLEHVEGFYQQLESLLLDIGYLYPHTASSRMQKFRRLFNRARLEEEEVALLRGILSQMRWAMKQGRSPN
jgi:tRNA/rRNA methyltransferase